MPIPARQLGRPINVAVLGTGQMGLVCAHVLCSSDRARGTGEFPLPHVFLWGHDPIERERLRQTRESSRLPGFRVPDGAEVLLDDDRLRRADLIVVAIATQHIRQALERLCPLIGSETGLISTAKGIENRTLLTPIGIIRDVLGGSRSAGVLSGPTIAGELARCLPATMVAASVDEELTRLTQVLFSTSWLRVYTHHDTIGVEIAGAAKNVIALAAGILDGLHAGFNAKSALLARGLAEITRLGVALGAERETFFGVAGVGDLATTCFSPEGRNRSCGEALGRGEKLDAYLTRAHHVVEGVATCQSVVDLARGLGIEMPITESVRAVLFDGLDPLTAISRLMSREPRDEQVG